MENTRMNRPKISIITVVYNGEEYIERTIKSVIGQTYDNIEFVIVDGNSTDSTKEIIAQYETDIEQYVSEKDDGIYDAMNKGLDLATGDYVWFINAGDEVYDNETIEKIFSNYDDEDVFYGRTQLVNEDGSNGIITLTPKVLSWKNFVRGMVVSHQSIIFKADKVKHYTMEYKIIADQDFIIDGLKNSIKIKNTEIPLSRYLLGGFSESNIRALKQERLRVAYKHYGLLGLVQNHVYIAFDRIKTKIRNYIKGEN